MLTLKLSPSLLEQYRIVRLGLYNKGPEALIEYLTGTYVKSEPASRGSAYHEMLEHGIEPYAFYWHKTGKLKHEGEWVPVAHVSAEEAAANKKISGPFYCVLDKDINKWWYFTAEAVEPAAKLHQEYKDMIHETWIDYDTTSHGYKIKLRMKIDGLQGLVMHEHKTTGRKKKYSDYWDSIQWRCYACALPELTTIRYNIFQLNTRNTKCDTYHFDYLPDELSKTIVQQEIDGLVDWMIKNDYAKLKVMTKDRNPLPI